MSTTTPSPAGTAALVVAAGRGLRFGGAVPKQYGVLAGRTVLRHAVEGLLAHPAVANVRVVIHPDDRALYDADVAGLALPRVVIDKIYYANAVREFVPAKAGGWPMAQANSSSKPS